MKYSLEEYVCSNDNIYLPIFLQYVTSLHTHTGRTGCIFLSKCNPNISYCCLFTEQQTYTYTSSTILYRTLNAVVQNIGCLPISAPGYGVLYSQPHRMHGEWNTTALYYYMYIIHLKRSAIRCMLFKPNETSPCIHVSHLKPALVSNPLFTLDHCYLYLYRLHYSRRQHTH